MKKKILFIHDSMNGGGAERVLVTLLGALSRDKFDITLLLIFGKGPFMKSIPADIEAISLFDNGHSLFQSALYHIRPVNNAVRKMLARRHLGNRHFDTIVSFMEGPSVKMHDMLYDYGDNHCSWIHTNLRQNRWYNNTLSEKDERQFYSKVKKIAFVSTESKEVFEQMFGQASGHEVIYNPLDADNIRKTKRTVADEHPFTIIAVGRLEAVKRHEILLATAAMLRERGLNFKVKLLGVGSREAELKQMTRDLGLDDIVTFAGFVSNPYPDMANADIMLLTSEAEGFGMVVAEALTLGLPVISTPLGCIDEMLAHGGGFCVADDKPATIADAVEPYIRDGEKLAALRSEAAVAGRQFDLTEIMRQIEAFID